MQPITGTPLFYSPAHRVTRDGTDAGAAYSEAECLRALLTTRYETFRYELHRIVAGVWTVVADVTNLVHSCTISYDRFATNFMGSARLEIVDPDGTINFLTDAIRCFHQVRMPDGNYIEWIKGTFYVPSPTTPFTQPMVHTVDTQDALRNLVDTKLTDFFTIPSAPPGGGFDDGDPLGWAERLISDKYPLAGIDLGGPTSIRVPADSPHHFPPGTAYLDVVNTLIAEIANFDQLRANVTGSYISTPFVPPSSRSLEFTYVANSSSVVVRDTGTATQDLWGSYNQWLRYVSDPANTGAVLRVRRTITDPDNPLSTTYRNRTVTSVDVSKATDLPTLVDEVDRLYEVGQSVLRTVKIETPLMPHEHQDKVGLLFPTQDWGDEANGVYILRRWTFPCVAGAKMTQEYELVPSAATDLGPYTGLGAGSAVDYGSGSSLPSTVTVPRRGSRSTSYWIEGAPATLTVTGRTPAVIRGTHLFPAAASLTVTGIAPTIYVSIGLAPNPAALVLTMSTPEIPANDSMVQIAEQVLGSDTATFDFTSIPATYSHLLVVLNVRSARVSQNDAIAVQFNNDSGTNYDYQIDQRWGNTSSDNFDVDGDTSAFIGEIAAANAPASVSDQMVIWVPRYAGTTFQKNLEVQASLKRDTTTGNFYVQISSGWWRNTAAINRLTVLSQNGTNFKTGSVATLYGI